MANYELLDGKMRECAKDFDKKSVHVREGLISLFVYNRFS